MNESYDVIVLGLGAMGSAAAYHLAKRGYRVLGLDAYSQGHKLGSSHGRSRIIRQAYADSSYVLLAQHAYSLWRELEREAGKALLTVTGSLNIGAPDSVFIAGVLASARRYALPCQELTDRDVANRFPGLRLPSDLVAILEQDAGFLDPEACIGTHLDVATQRGAILHHEEPVVSWTSDGESVQIRTPSNTYAGSRLIITPGPWASDVLADLHLPLSVERVINVHFAPTRPDLFTPDWCPIYLLEVDEGSYYGFPSLPGQGLKIGQNATGEVCTPDTIQRGTSPEEIEALRAVLDRYLPGAAGAVLSTLVCMYTNTPDRHFVVDLHPLYPNVAYGCGFSGHGFKFSPAIGEVLADLSTSGTTRQQVGFLSASRFRQSATSGVLTYGSSNTAEGTEASVDRDHHAIDIGGPRPA